jgi:hypothetical protein
VFDDPFMIPEELRVPFVEFESAALCRGDAPDPFEKGLEVPFELLEISSALILLLLLVLCDSSVLRASTESSGLS